LFLILVAVACRWSQQLKRDQARHYFLLGYSRQPLRSALNERPGAGLKLPSPLGGNKNEAKLAVYLLR
jgi:hypothetical protein